MVKQNKNPMKKIKRLNEKINKFNKKIGLIVFGIIASIGIFVMAAAGTWFLNYFFESATYSKPLTLFLQLIFVMTFYKVSKDMKINFKIGYLTGSAIFTFLIIFGMIFGGLGWKF